MTGDPAAALLALAAAQHGAFTWAQALAAGWSRAAADGAVTSGAWQRVGRGAFCHRPTWEALDERDRHRCIVHARLLHKTSSWSVARRSAAVWHDLPLLGRDPVVPQLVRPKAHVSDRATSRHERLATLPEADVVVVDGLSVTGLGRTVVDLARGEGLRSGVVVADAALRAGLSQEVLLDVAQRCAGWPGGAEGLKVARFADGLAESPLESLSRVGFRRLGLPAPELQVEVWEGRRFVARVDHLWRATDTVGQADGALKYDGRRQVLADKWQDEWLENLGFEVVRWGWEHAWRPRGVLDVRVRRAMARGARQELDPRVRLVPTTLAQNLRRRTA
jgi:hypothetical protein